MHGCYWTFIGYGYVMKSIVSGAIKLIRCNVMKLIRFNATTAQEVTVAREITVVVAWEVAEKIRLHIRNGEDMPL